MRKLFESLTDAQKKELRYYINQEEYEKLEKEKQEKVLMNEDELKSRNPGLLKVSDFVEYFPVSVRLKAALLKDKPSSSKFYYIEDVTKKEFFKKHNAGQKTWDELIDIINNSLKGSKFDFLEKALKKHFAKQDSL